MLEDTADNATLSETGVLDYPVALVKSEIRQSVDDWIDSVNSGFASTIGALYTPSAVLLATFDPKMLSTPAERNQYFVNFKTRRGLKAFVNECHVEVLGKDAGVASGLYTFRFIGEDGSEQTVKARFTFVFARQTEGDWLIAAHHSSVAPSIV